MILKIIAWAHLLWGHVLFMEGSEDAVFSIAVAVFWMVVATGDERKAEGS